MIDRCFEWTAARHWRAAALLVVLTLATALPGFSSLFPMDRDEPRFAQASKQMLETSDFIDIRLQDEARNKKPVGIYWLQAAVVASGEWFGVPDARRAIWLYRLPSLLGALAAVLLTYWTALGLTTRRAAVLAGAALSGVILLAVEAHLAKTDAALLATVVAVMGVLGRAWMTRDRATPLSLGLCAVFWTAMAAGILIKGPITPMVPLFAAVVLSLRHRSGRWLRALRPVHGLLWCLLLVLPWFILIVKATGTAFFAESVGHDMAGKVAGVQESHGAPFGTYAAAFWVTAWPLAPFLLLAAPMAWRDRWSDRMVFLLAWIVPTWLLFESVPTKLPHYVLPLYPALAILIASSLERGTGPDRLGGVRRAAFAVLLALVPLALPVALVLARGRAASSLDAPTIVLAVLAFALALAAVVCAARWVDRGAWPAALAASLLAAFCIEAFVLGWFMNARHADLLALSPRLADAARAADPACARIGYASVGDREPSLVFLTETSLLMTDAKGAAAFVAGGPCRVAFVTQPDEAAFTAALASGPSVRLASRVAGTNINGGKRLDIGIYVRQDGAP